VEALHSGPRRAIIKIKIFLKLVKHRQLILKKRARFRAFFIMSIKSLFGSKNVSICGKAGLYKALS
jgi:hypothetical protein